MIANEAIHVKEIAMNEGFKFNIDLENACDHVDWKFIGHVLYRMGFGYKWRGWSHGAGMPRREETSVLSYKVYFVHSRGFIFLVMGVLGITYVVL